MGTNVFVAHMFLALCTERSCIIDVEIENLLAVSKLMLKYLNGHVLSTRINTQYGLLMVEKERRAARGET